MVEHIGEPSINELRIALDQYEEALKRWREVAILYNQTRGMRTSPVDPDDQRHLYRLSVQVYHCWADTAHIGEVEEHDYAQIACAYLLTVDRLSQLISLPFSS